MDNVTLERWAAGKFTNRARDAAEKETEAARMFGLPDDFFATPPEEMHSSEFIIGKPPNKKFYCPDMQAAYQAAWYRIEAIRRTRHHLALKQQLGPKLEANQLRQKEGNPFELEQNRRQVQALEARSNELLPLLALVEMQGWFVFYEAASKILKDDRAALARRELLCPSSEEICLREKVVRQDPLLEPVIYKLRAGDKLERRLVRDWDGNPQLLLLAHKAIYKLTEGATVREIWARRGPCTVIDHGKEVPTGEFEGPVVLHVTDLPIEFSDDELAAVAERTVSVT